MIQQQESEQGDLEAQENKITKDSFKLFRKGNIDKWKMEIQ